MLIFNRRRSGGGLPQELAALFSVLWTTTVKGDELPSQDGNSIVITDKDFTVINYIPSDSEATFSLPDVAELKVDDEDNLWFDVDGNVKQVTVADLIGQDYTRTLVKYSNFEPYNIDWIAVLKSTSEPTPEQWDLLHKYFQLWFLWSGTINDYGVLKDNRELVPGGIEGVEFELTSTGDGTGITALRFTTSDDIELTIDGNGLFYDNAAGTTGEDTTKSFSGAGNKVIYIKVSSGTCNLIFSNKNVITKFGELYIPFWHGVTNSVMIDVTNLAECENCLEFVSYSAFVTGDIAPIINNSSLIAFELTNSQIVCDITNLKDALGLKRISVNDSPNTTGSISDFSNLTLLEYFRIESDVITGNIDNFYLLVNLKTFALRNDLITGNISVFENTITLEDFITNSTGLTGSLSSLSNLTNLYVITVEADGITGDVSSLSGCTALGWIDFRTNGISGDLSSLNQLEEIHIINTTGNAYTFDSSAKWETTRTSFTFNLNSTSLDTTDVDNIVISFYNTPTVVSGLINIANSHRTTASDVAYADLDSRAINLNINPPL